MRITQILIENFGIYKGLCEFKFEYDPKRKVTLLKGENGSGKTTLLNSIKTVLYGSLLVGSQKQNNAKYINIIERTLNTEAKKDPFSRFSIEVEISANLQQFSGRYRINRAWKWVNKKIQEELSIYQDDRILGDAETEEFFKILYRLYPLELFELFYLDGEKIDQLSFFDSNIHNLIESTMNIDLFKTLRNDLETYAIKKHGTVELEKLKKDKDYTQQLVDHLEEKVRSNHQQLIELRISEQDGNGRIEQFTKEIASSNQNLPEVLQRTNDEIKQSKKEISRHIVETIPLLLLETEIDKMSQQLEKEANDSKSKIIREALNNSLRDQILLDNTSLARENIEEVFELIKFQFIPSEKIIHGINFDEHKELSILFSRINAETKMAVNQLYTDYYILIDEVKELNDGMASFDANKINQLLDELLSAKNSLHDIQVQIMKINDQTIIDQTQIDSLKLKLNNLDGEIWKAIKSENVNQVISKMTNVVEAYVKSIKVKKITSIESLTKEMFESLIRKKGFISKVTIDEDEIYLTTNEGNKLLVSSLSSGEKQLFVLSIIFALVKVSERSTPLIFDTLLGRLDKNHQQEVMEKFIAQCPDQVIILATDSELENIKSETLDALVKTKYSIDLSKQTNRIEVFI